MKYDLKQQIAISILVLIPTIAIITCAPAQAKVINNTEVTNLDTSLQESKNIVTYTLSVPGKPDKARTATICNITNGTLWSYTSAININGVLYDLTISKDLALYVCGQKEA